MTERDAGGMNLLLQNRSVLATASITVNGTGKLCLQLAAGVEPGVTATTIAGTGFSVGRIFVSRSGRNDVFHACQLLTNLADHFHDRSNEARTASGSCEMAS
jgi:hypothetical protein